MKYLRLMLCLVVGLALLGAFQLATPTAASAAPLLPLAQSEMMAAPTFDDLTSSIEEIEPNDTAATAQNVVTGNFNLKGYILPGDNDWFSFTAAAGDVLFAATQTAGSASSSTDSILTLYGADATTIIEEDDQNGSFGASASVIAGTPLTAGGTYYLRVRNAFATSEIRPYFLYVNTRSGTPIAEVEPNGSTTQPIPANSWVAGTLTSTATVIDNDYYSFSANAGDTIYLALDLDPERDNVDTTALIGVGAFSNFTLTANDAGGAGPDAEAHFITVRTTGTYYALVASPTASATGIGAYRLAVQVIPAAAQSCTTYSYSGAPVPIADLALTSISLNVPGSPLIGDINVGVDLTHPNSTHLDVSLVGPDGDEIGLFDDLGVANTPLPTVTLVLDEEAAIPLNTYTVLTNARWQPEPAYRLSWLYGENAGGTWTLNVRDDTSTLVGTLRGFSVEICAPPVAQVPTCPVGFEPQVVYSSNFDADDGGFTHSGTADEWERGLPTGAPIASCNNGSAACWDTDLDNTYDISSSQQLLSPDINLVGATGGAYVTWYQKYQMENATFDDAFVNVQENGGANPRELWRWHDATMQVSMGSPTVLIEEAAGWALYQEDISDYIGGPVELTWNLVSDTTVNLDGLAVDDVTVFGCFPGATPTATATATTAPATNTSTATATTTTAPATNTSTATATVTPGPSNTPTTTVTGTPPTSTPTATSTTGPTPTPVPAAITLDKTVGTNPSLCAATSAIVIPSAQNVTYCYTVTNTGGVTYTLHDLEDSELGTILNNFPFTLVPGASAFLTATTMITQTTVNTATWTAFNQDLYALDYGTDLYNFIDISTTGADLGLFDDSEANVTLPFTFTFYSTASTALRVGNNGGILFNTTTGDVGFTNAALPTGIIGGAAILPFWDDIDDESGDVYFQTTGVAPNRIAVIQWEDRPHFDITARVDFGTWQVQLHEATGDIYFMYQDVDFDTTAFDNGVSATIGLQRSTTQAQQYSFNEARVQGSFGIRWSNGVSATDSATVTLQGGTATATATGTLPTSTATATTGPTNTATATATTGPTNTATATATQVPGGPEINVTPAALNETHENAPEVTTQTLTIQNQGSSDLTWTISEEENAPDGPAAPAPIGPQFRDRTGAGGSEDGASLGTSDAGVSLGVGAAPAPIALAPEAPNAPLGTLSEDFDDITTLPGAGWSLQNLSAPVGTTGWFQGNDAVFPSQTGAPTAYIGANFNNTAGVGTISNWLITPVLNLENGDTLTFWTRTTTANPFPDRMQVRMSTAGASTNVGATATSVGDFTNLLLDINPTYSSDYPDVWTEFTVTGTGAWRMAHRP